MNLQALIDQQVQAERRESSDIAMKVGIEQTKRWIARWYRTNGKEMSYEAVLASLEADYTFGERP